MSLTDTHIQTATQTKVKIKNILFATDFSPAANAALPYAAGIARHYGAKLHAVHVTSLPIPPAVGGMYGTVPAGGWSPVIDEAELTSKAELEQLLGRFSGIESEAVVRTGEVWPIVAGMVKAYGIDLVVIGTHGRTGLQRMLGGSVAEAIFRTVACPVLTIGPRCSQDLNRTGEFRHILFATNFNTTSHSAAELAVSIAQENQAHLVLLHVVESPRTNELLRSEPLVPLSLRALEDMLTALGETSFRHHSVVEIGDTAEKILQVARGNDADLIVLGAHASQRQMGAAAHFPATTVHQVVSRALCPVLTVRE